MLVAIRRCVSVVLLSVFAIPVCAQTSVVPSVRAYLDSRNYPDGKNFVLAEELCRKELAEKQGDPQLTLLLVEALIGQEKLQSVPGVLSPAIEAHPRNTELLLKRATAYSSLGQTGPLLNDCQQLKKLGDGRGIVLAVQEFEKEGVTQSGLWSYCRLLDVFPEADDRADWQFARAKHFTSLNMFDWAEYDIKASLKAEWQPLKALLLGEILARQQRFDEAETVLQQVFERVDESEHFIAEQRRLRVVLDMDELDKVAFLLQKYDEKYEGTNEFAGADDIRERFQSRLKIIEQQKEAAKKQNRPSGFESADESTAEREQMKQLRGSNKPEDVAEVKRLMLRHAQFGMESEEPEYAKVMLKLLEDGKEKFQLSESEQARRATVYAWLLIQEGEYIDALANADAATRLDPTFGDAWRMKGLANYMLDDNNQAVADVSKAIELDPLNATAHGLRGLISTDLKNYDNAAQDLRRAEELSPTNRWLAGVRAHFFREVDLGTPLLLNSCQANPGNTLERCELLLELGFCDLVCMDIMEYSQAADESEAPQMAPIWARAAYQWYTETIQYDAGGPSAEQVAKACSVAHQHHPDDPNFPSMIADVLQFQGMYPEAIEWAEKALAKSSESAELLHQLGNLYLLEGKLAEAQDASEKMQQARYQDDVSVGLRNELETIVELAADLTTTLDELKFRTDTSNALVHLLATPDDTAETFSPDFAKKLDVVYADMKPHVGKAPSPDAGTLLQLSAISTTDLATQEKTLFSFDEELAAIVPQFAGGHFWFTAKYRASGELSGKTYCYFVKLEDGWKIFPKPWLAD